MNKEAWLCEKNEKVKNLISKLYRRRMYEACLRAIEMYAYYMYSLNQRYYDEFAEEKVYKIFKKLNISRQRASMTGQDEYVAFFDSFGLESRGLAYIYLKALVDSGYNVIYITDARKKAKIEKILEMLNQNPKNKAYFIKKSRIIKPFMEMAHFLEQYKLKSLFIYITPYDTQGLFLSYLYERNCTRYFINLTDHAFWLGRNAFDYIIEFRDYGASVSKLYREIDEDKIIKIPYYPLIDKSIPFQGFPDGAKGKKVIFSGGFLYKTLSSDNKYYKIISHILSRHNDTVFIYAGTGDDGELRKMAQMYPDRVFHLPERKDLYQVMRHSYVYISTYPIIGGLMTQYAVAANTVPFTLLHDDCGKGILLHPEKAGIEFTNLDLYLREVDHCLTDVEYLERKKTLLRDQIIGASDFNTAVRTLIQERSSNYAPVFEEVNTEAFQKEYFEQFTKLSWIKCVCNLRYVTLAIHFKSEWVQFLSFKCKKLWERKDLTFRGKRTSP